MTLQEDDLNRIATAAETIETSLSRLVEAQDYSRSAYHEDTDLQDIVERRFLKCTEAALDIATVLVTHERDAPPETNPESMQALGEIGVLDPDEVEAMVQATRFRNVLAHTYGDAIDNDIVYDALQDLDRYRQFLFAVRNYLDDSESLEW